MTHLLHLLAVSAAVAFAGLVGWLFGAGFDVWSRLREEWAHG